MELRIKKESIGYALICSLLILCAMNFSAKFFYFVFALFFSLLLTQKTLLFNNKAIVYLGLGVLMAVYNMDEGLLSMLRCLACCMMYLVGYNMVIVRYHKKIEEGDVRLHGAESVANALIISMCVGSFIHYALNALSNIGSNIGRNTIDIWSNQIMAATGQAAIACLMLGLSVAWIYQPSKKIYRFVGIAAIAAVLAYNLTLAGRTLIVVLGSLFVIGFLFVNKIRKKGMEKLRLVIGFVLTIMVAILVISLNIGGIRDYISESNLFDRFTLSFDNFFYDSTRNSSKLGFILNGWKYPFGGLHLRSAFGYAHDLLLDGYDEYGIFGFLFLVAILLFGLFSLYHLLKRTSYSNSFKIVLLCVYTAILLYFTVEPILAGMAWLFSCYCLINGCMDGLNEAHRLYDRES